ncbi:MAG TPA: 2OG-Fe(II) oxygenase [Burkholderiales bacterium]|jgi:SM-20-related protein|nr:2OG-Fe(II) oxygenase [Burkholderiales bacterium]
METFDAISESIAAEGWRVLPDFIDQETIAALRDECRQLAAAGMFRKAGIGQSAKHKIQEDTRGDEILWLEAARGNSWRERCLARFEQLRLALNRELQLGLFEFECHFSRYAPGAFYRKHLDQFRDDGRRRLSCVLYLNEDWEPGDGGELRLHLDAGATKKCEDVLPVGGTLVTFLSARFAHEVLPAKRERLSLAGWFRAR